MSKILSALIAAAFALPLKPPLLLLPQLLRKPQPLLLPSQPKKPTKKPTKKRTRLTLLWKPLLLPSNTGARNKKGGDSPAFF